jgi:prepilin-type N-terminal cleavage/methylation domain-containing protein
MNSCEKRNIRVPRSDSTAAFSLVELLIVIAIILILAALEIPSLMRARVAANQAAALSSLRAIQTAEMIYAVTYNRGYSPSLADLGPGSDGLASPEGAYLIDSILASGEKSGYTFVYIPGIVRDGKIETYTAEALPVVPCATGLETYSISPATGPVIATLGSGSDNPSVTSALAASLGSVTQNCSSPGW